MSQLTPNNTTRRFTLEQIMDATDKMEGLCLDCGHSSGCCEPDAKAYKCEHCGELAVYGPDEILFSSAGVV